MGKELSKLYEHIQTKYGQIALYRLIVKTRISSSEAKNLEDTEENLTLVKKAIEELEFSTVAESTTKKKNRWWKRILKDK